MFGNKEKKIEKMVEKRNAAGLIHLAGDKDSVIALKAVEALGHVPGDDSYNTLITLLRSPRADMRAAAATALGTLGDPKAQAHISHMLTTEKDAVVLEAIPANATAVGVPARVVKLDGVRVTQDLDQIHMPDPVGQEFASLKEQITALSKRVEQLEKENRALKESRAVE